MKNYTVRTLIVGIFTILLLSACSGTKEQLGLTRQSPDEFKVIKRAPLDMPPAYGLRPPEPGAPRPQEQSPDEQARQSVFGTTPPAQRPAQSSGEALLLQQAAAHQADPDIRRKVDAETLEQKDRNKPVVQKLLGIGGGRDEVAASVVDAKAEARRIKDNKDSGKPVTEGETPSIEE